MGRILTGENGRKSLEIAAGENKEGLERTGCSSHPTGLELLEERDEVWG